MIRLFFENVHNYDQLILYLHINYFNMKANKENPKTVKNAPKAYQPPKPILPEHQKFMTNVGNNLMELRKTRNISVLELSKQTGISRNAYTQMESGTSYFNLLKFFTVLEFYKISPIDFFKKMK